MASNQAASNSPKREPPEVLSGWKTIANYLGRGVRTVQRYERELDLPVRRPAGRPRGSVVATKTEIDAWVSASPIPASQMKRLVKKITQELLAEIKNSIRMCRLCDEMRALRSELPEPSWTAVSGQAREMNSFTVVGSDFRRCRLMELLATDSGRRKRKLAS